tara:strand:- start:71 stop:574 length:504 start_codon:yes stop_codon:yes gene_type:complete
VEDDYEVAYNLGCGKKNWDGWLNVDQCETADIQCDIRKLEVANDSANAVAAIHVLEHFYEWEAFNLLTEWRRILKPGGKMIIEVPCLDKVFAYIADQISKNQILEKYMTVHPIFGDGKHKNPAMMHKTGYFVNSLNNLLIDVGMREVTLCEPRYHFPHRDMRFEAIK